MNLIELIQPVPTLTLISFLIMSFFVTFWLYQREIDRKNKAQDELLMFANKGDFFMKKRIMRLEEFEFYKQLRQVISKDYYLYPQVNLSSIIDIKNNFKDHDNLYLLLGNKSVDYVVLDKQLFPVLLIELNGKSHFWHTRRNRDKLVESLVTKIGIKFLAINKDSINIEDIEKEINRKLTK